MTRPDGFPADLTQEDEPPAPPSYVIGPGGYSDAFGVEFNRGPNPFVGETCGGHAARRTQLAMKSPAEYHAAIVLTCRQGAGFSAVLETATDLRKSILESTINNLRPALIEELALESITELSILDTALLALGNSFFYRALQGRIEGITKAEIQALERLDAMAVRGASEFRESIAFLRILTGRPLQGLNPGQRVAIQVNTMIQSREGTQ